MSKEIHIGSFIKYFRKKKHLTQTALAEGICDKDYLYKIETGKNEPSIFVLEALSKKLNVNLLEYRHDIFKYTSSEVYEMYTNLNLLLSTEDKEGVKNYILECNKEPSFKTGDLYLFLQYSKAWLAFYDEKYDESIALCLEGMNTAGFSLDINKPILSTFSNEAILLIKLYAINLHITEKIDEALAIYEQLYKELYYVVERPVYELNKALHFQAVHFMNISYNLGVLYTEKHKYDKAEQIINDALKLSRRTNYANMYIPLLICLIDVYYNTNRLNKAQETWNDIQVLAKYFGKDSHYDYFVENCKKYMPELNGGGI